MADQHIYQAPVAIGGVGGSGTRLIASIVQQLGFYMGSDLNDSMDNLLFTLLFKRKELWPIDSNQNEIAYLLKLFVDHMQNGTVFKGKDLKFVEQVANQDRLQHKSDWLQQRLKNSLSNQSKGEPRRLWGWKEPNTHIFLPALEQTIPSIKYIHVMRHGLDMAYSSNQNQLQLWGKLVIKESDLPQTKAEASFRYWCWAHRRINDLAHRMDRRYLCINFEEFCSNAEKGLMQLMAFLNLSVPEQKISELAGPIKLPTTVNRYVGNLDFKPADTDIKLLQQLGYSYSG